MRAIEGSQNGPSRFPHSLDQACVNVPEIFPGDAPAIQPGLIADNDHGNPVIVQPSQGQKGVFVEPEFATMFDVVRAICIDDTIPVQQQKMPGLTVSGADPNEHELFPDVPDPLPQLTLMGHPIQEPHRFLVPTVHDQGQWNSNSVPGRSPRQRIMLAFQS